MSHRHPSTHRLVTVAGTLLIVAFLALGGATAALADGDPASDVLVTSELFLPYQLSVTRQTQELTALLERSAAAGFPIRVALIDAPDDLGTVGALWSRPRTYAGYLGYELSLSFRGQVLVVMPDGMGVYPGRIAPSAAERTVAGELPAPGSGPGMVGAAIAAVRRLAAAEGHPLSTSGLRVSVPLAGRPSSPIPQILALLLGAVLIALAWRASLRARPLDRRPRSPRGGVVA
jgi:hypothetical protein